MLEKRFRGNVDGDYGSSTRAVLEEACNELHVPTPLTTQTSWFQFLDAVTRFVFHDERHTRPDDYDCTRHH